MRDIYNKLEDNAFVEVDMNAFAYSQKYSWLFSVFIKFDSSKEDQDGYEEFLETKEALIISLELDEKAKYVGMRVADGWSELYFYAKFSKGLDKTVAQMLTPSNYIFESNVVKDTKWDFYQYNLHPNELELCHIQSEKIIEMLKEEDDINEEVRDVEHYVSFETPTQKDRFLENFDVDGFEFKDEVSTQEFENGLAFIKKHSVTSDVVKVEVELMFEAVKKQNGFYEGWSTILVTNG